MAAPRLVSVEYLVHELDRALELLVDHMGFEIVDRGPHPAVDADTVILQSGELAITLVHPTTNGDRDPITDQDPRMTQMVFTVPDSGQLLSLRDRMIEAGVSLSVDAPGVFHLNHSMIEGIFGEAPAPVFMVEPGKEG